MTDKAQVKPFWVVFDPEGYAIKLGESKEEAIDDLVWDYSSHYLQWPEYEQAGYRCLECVDDSDSYRMCVQGFLVTIVCKRVTE